MNQFNSSWRFVYKNFKNLIFFGLPWLVLTIISIGFISKRMPQIQIDENIAPDIAITELIETLSKFYENNVNQLFIIELMINILFIVFIASLAVQYKNITNSINPQGFFRISRIKSKFSLKELIFFFSSVALPVNTKSSPAACLFFLLYK